MRSPAAALLAALFCLPLLALPAEASKIGDLLKKLRIDEIEKPAETAPPAQTSSPADSAPGAPVSGGESIALGEIESLLAAKKFKDAIARIDEMCAKGEGGDVLPFLSYLRGRIAAANLQDRDAAIRYYRETSERFPQARYGLLARESLEALGTTQITELTLKARMDGLKTEIDALTAELEATSFVRFLRRAELKKKLVDLQGRYVAAKDLLESFRESPEALVKREGEGRRVQSPAARATAARTARALKDGYNLRDKPWGKVVGTLKKGQKLEIVGTEKVDGKTWYKVRVGDKTAYVFEAGVAVEGGGAEEIAEEPQDEFQSGIVRRLVAIVYGAGADDPTDLSDPALVTFFLNQPELSRAFPEMVEKRDAKEMRAILTGLLRMIHHTPLRRALGKPLARRDYAGAYRLYREKHTENYADPAIFPFNESAVPTVIINIAAKRLRVYRDGLPIFDVPMVPGQKKYPGETGNTKTRVGSYKVESWHESYTTADYPVKWSDDVWAGAFGKWCAKIGPKGQGQHIHGTRGPEILGNIPINYAPGSHGCIRLANKNITRLHEMVPVGAKVIKTYCLHERAARRGVFGESFKTSVYDNLYDYDVTKDGWFYPGAGVFIDHQEPADAVR